jgi:tetratricopeptide (TPR) repeat protein
MVGISIALASSSNWLLNNLPQYKKYIVGASLVLLAAFSLVTYDRNKFWSTPEKFLEHDVQLSGGSPRALHNLASWYQQDGQYDKALDTMRELIKANDGGLSLTHSTTYLAVLLNVRLYNDVLDLTEKLLDFSANSYERAIILRYMGTAFTGVADDEAAVDSFEEAMRTLQLDYDSGLAYGYSLIQLGRVGDAFKHIESMRQRFGDRTKLRMLAKVADTALQNQRAVEAAADVPDQ